MKVFLALFLACAHLIVAGFATHAILTSLHPSRLRMAQLLLAAWLVPIVGAIWVYHQLNYFGPKGDSGGVADYIGGEGGHGGGVDGD